MINTKQRAFLRGLANKLEPCMQVGKDGAKQTSFDAISNLLEARELIKIKVLQNCDQTAKEIAQMIAQNVGCDVVQVIGNKIVLFKVSSKEKIKHIEIGGIA